MREIDVKKLYEIAGRQALALEEEIFNFSDRLRNNFELKIFFEDIGVSPENKKRLLTEIEPKASKLFRELIGLLVEQALMRKFSWLTENFSKEVSQKTGTGFVEIRSAETLPEAERKKIKNFVGEKTRLRFMIKPELIGGVSLHWEDGRCLDASFAGALHKMEESILV